MKKGFALSGILFLMSLSLFAQNNEGQYSVEGGYGLGLSGKPGITDYGHFNVGLRYMISPTWGVKFDYGHDKFRTNSTPETGVDYNRISAQAVYNAGRDLNLPVATNGYVNLLLHAGAGLSRSSSTQMSNKDNMGNLIIGITPQFYISPRFAIQADFSYVANLLQHFDYDGNYRYAGEPKSFTGGQTNISIGLVYYMGKRKSDYDWR